MKQRHSIPEAIRQLNDALRTGLYDALRTGRLVGYRRDGSPVPASYWMDHRASLSSSSEITFRPEDCMRLWPRPEADE